MADSVGQFPNFPTYNIQEGHIFFDVVTNTLYVFRGGNPQSSANWAVLDIRDSSAVILDDEFMGGTLLTGDIGDLGWSLSGTVAVTGVSAVANHHGIRRFTTAALVAVYGAHLGSDPNNFHEVLFNPALAFAMTFVVRPQNIDADVTYRLGLMGTFSAAPANGVYFERLGTDANWFGVCRSGGVETRVNTGVPIAVDWFKLRLMSSSSGAVTFVVNDGANNLVGTNIPTSILSPGFSIGVAVGAAKAIDVDYVKLALTSLSR